MKFKKISAILLSALILAGVMTACGTKGEDTGESKESALSEVNSSKSTVTNKRDDGLLEDENFVYQILIEDEILMREYIGSSDEIIIPDTLEGFPVTALEIHFLPEGCNVKKITVSDNVETLHEKAFSDCPELEEVVIGEKLDCVYGYCFQNCTALKEIVFPETIDYIGQQAFSGCTSLEKVVIPENADVTNIGFKAFEGCTSLKEIYLPAEISSIGD